MLIRLCSHFINNPHHIDKLICINGLPDEFFFRPVKRMVEGELVEGNELIPPWEPDIESNIPREIRHLCSPVEIVKIFPPIEKGREPVVSRFTALGLRFNYMSEAGNTMWERIEHYMERSVPRDVMIPKPVLVAPDHKSIFNPHEAKRTQRGSLELRPAEVPVVDIRTPVISIEREVNRPPIITSPISEKTISQDVSVVKETVSQIDSSQSVQEKITSSPYLTVYECVECGKSWNDKRALNMHRNVKHKAVIDTKIEPARV